MQLHFALVNIFLQDDACRSIFSSDMAKLLMADMDPDMSGRDCAMGCCESQNICFLHSFLLHIEAGSLF
jgi:hypothetical protein